LKRVELNGNLLLNREIFKREGVDAMSWSTKFGAFFAFMALLEN
jgi:hypothetical protein